VNGRPRATSGTPDTPSSGLHAVLHGATATA
jgi:hypothetical protein